jgi:peptidyl-lysine (3S)-dioxygenase / protease
MDVDRALSALHQEARELWVPRTIPRIPYHPSALAFLREYVALNTPVIFTDCPCPSWPDDHLLSVIGDDGIIVNRTPAGFGDHADDTSGMFVKPWQTEQSFRSFLGELNQHRRDSVAPKGAEAQSRFPGIPYYSVQSDCLRKGHAALLKDLPPLTFACAAFGAEPDAINLWVGDGRSFTATHKDHYENLYMVVRGAKRFFLRPPCDAAQLPERDLRAATYAPCVPTGGDALHAVADTPASSVRWILHDKADAPRVPDVRGGRDLAASGREPLVADVAAGEMLYLPALWYHAVGQRGVTVAVNWWFDMSFCGPAYVYYNFLRRLTGQDDSDDGRPQSAEGEDLQS